MLTELLSVLKGHVQKYPWMQVRDAVKLIYQNEMGPGHMVKSEADSLRRLEMEFPKSQAGSALFEDIGNGLCRLYLGALREQDITLGTVNRFFLHTANNHRGSIPALEGFHLRWRRLAEPETSPSLLRKQWPLSRSAVGKGTRPSATVKHIAGNTVRHIGS